MTEGLAHLAPTELRPGEDPVTRFVREARLVQTEVTVVPPDEVVGAVTRALAAAAVRSVALASDLGEARDAVRDSLGAAGLTVHLYEDVAGHRDVVRDLDATVTGCLAAVAATGSVVTSAAAGRAGALVAPMHVCVVPRTRLVDGLTDLLLLAPRLGAGSMMALQTGPSRTADIEKTLILGMHGPKAVHVVLATDGARP